MVEIIDSFHYCDSDDDAKIQFYTRKLNLKEKRKTKKINSIISNYIEKLHGKEKILNEDNRHKLELKYYERTGYISLVKGEKDIYNIYYYGLDEEEAYYNAIINYEMTLNSEIEKNYRESLKGDFSYRRFGEEEKPKEYHPSFYIAELSLQDLKWHYGDKIPKYCLDYFDQYISNYIGENFKYDIEANRIVKKQKQKVKSKID